MPRLTRWFIKTGLVYLVLALLTGVLVAADLAVSLPYPFAALAPLYYRILMIGWVTQLIFGVANWMFPIFTREAPRRRPTVGWFAYASLNLGLLLHIALEFLVVLTELPAGWTRVLPAMLWFIAAVAFVFNTWPRVKGR